MSAKRDEIWGRVVEKTRQEALAEGRAAAYAEILAMLREKWPTSVGASWAGLEASVVERVIDEIEARAKEQSP